MKPIQRPARTMSAGSAIAVALFWGCSDFGASSPSDEASAPRREAGAPNGEASAPSGDGGANDRDGESSADGACDTNCLLFTDNFERVTAAVQGPWTSMLGTTLNLVPEPVGTRGNVLHAWLPADSMGATVRTALLSVDVGTRSGVYLKFDFYVKTPSGGGFSTSSSYCDVAHVALGSRRIADLYINLTVSRYFLYGMTEAPDVGAELPITAPHEKWTTAEMKLDWSAKTTSTLTATLDNKSAAVTQPFPPNLTGATNVRVGLECHGTSPLVDVRVDSVVVQSLP